MGLETRTEAQVWLAKRGVPVNYTKASLEQDRKSVQTVRQGLTDEEKPRRQAASLGLRVIGTVGILELAANRGYIRDLKAVHDQLRQTDFYIDDGILNDSLVRHLAQE